jgi:hypothetical protein
MLMIYRGLLCYWIDWFKTEITNSGNYYSTNNVLTKSFIKIYTKFGSP